MHFQQPLVIPCKYLVSKAFCCVSLKEQGQGASLLAANGAISEEQRIMSAAAPTDAERFQAPVSLISMGGTHTEMGDSNPVGQKRKREALQIDAKTAAAAAMDEKEVLWRVNYEEFVSRLRHQACVAFVRSRIDAMAGTVLEGMLDATCRHETSVKQHSSGAWVMWVFLH
jgi:DNA-directed RNA polymerase III subunit RPC3